MLQCFKSLYLQDRQNKITNSSVDGEDEWGSLDN